VNEFKQVFNKDHIVKYHKLLKKTPIGMEEAIKKHVNIFKTFVTENRDAILTNKKEELKGDIIFSNNIYLNLIKCMETADADTCNVIFKHLQIILYLMNPEDDAIKQKCQDSIASKQSAAKGGNGEDKFLQNFMSKIENNFSEKEIKNPMEAAMNLLSTGIFQDMVGSMKQGVNSGELDISRLLGSVQGMLGGLGGAGIENDPQLSSMINMATNLMGNLNLGNGEQNPQ
jgi:hypothetical protein